MKKVLLLSFHLLIISIAPAQNLVINPGLDGYITCPGFGQFSSTYINSWDKPSIASSDYYHWNCPGIQPLLQVPRSGEGYAGIICYNYGGTEYREYITGTFSSPLVAGVQYEVEFYVSLHNGYIQAIEEIGAYISNTAPGPFGNVLHINVTPQIENISGALNDTANWKRVNGQYTAQGGEQFITIGNFHDDANTTITQPGTSGSYGAYYFVDDVSVMVDSTTSLHENTATSTVNVSYIGGNQIHVFYPDYAVMKSPLDLKCYSISGSLVGETIMNERSFVWLLEELKSGMYFISVSDAQRRNKVAKIIIY